MASVFFATILSILAYGGLNCSLACIALRCLVFVFYVARVDLHQSAYPALICVGLSCPCWSVVSVSVCRCLNRSAWSDWTASVYVSCLGLPGLYRSTWSASVRVGPPGPRRSVSLRLVCVCLRYLPWSGRSVPVCLVCVCPRRSVWSASLCHQSRCRRPQCARREPVRCNQRSYRRAAWRRPSLIDRAAAGSFQPRHGWQRQRGRRPPTGD